MWLAILACLFVGVFSAEFTLPGECPNMKLLENFNPTKFSGVWYNVASYASDSRRINDCATFDFQEDNLGFTMKETFIEEKEGNRTLKSYLARVDPTFDAGNSGRFIVSYEGGDKVLQFPFSILASDYENYAIAYTCKTLKKRIRTHYAYVWILSRRKEKLAGASLTTVENALAQYPELTEHRNSFVFKDFSETSCAYTKKLTEFFTDNFW